MKKNLLSAILCALLFLTNIVTQAQHTFKITQTFHIASPGGWDYIAINNGRLYVSHGTQVNILDENTGDSIGVIPNTTGVHGIAFDNALNKGYTSNGRLNNVTVFDLNTNEVITQIPTGQNPDAILYDPYSKKIITCNGRSNDLSVIDPDKGSVIATIPVGGKPEAAVSDGDGKLYVNIEDKNEIVAIDTKNFTVTNHWSIAPGQSPTGLAMDKSTKRLFSGCEKLLMVINATNGKVVDKIPIGDGCDGVAFDNKSKLIFTSNGEGNVTVIEEKGKDKFKIVSTIPTKRGARTLALDEKQHTLFLPTADFEAAETQNARPRIIPGTFQVLVIN